VAAVVVITTVAVIVWQPRRQPVRLLLRRALAAAEAGDLKDAAGILDDVLAREPANANALLLRGEVARDQGDESLAERCWGRVPDNPPESGGMARYLAGVQALKRRRARDAESLLRTAVRLNARYTPAREKLAALYLLQLRDRDLREELAAIRAARPWTISELTASLGSLGRIQSSPDRTGELERMVENDPEDLFSLLALFDSYLADDRRIEARRRLETAFAGNPREPRLLSRLIEMEIEDSQFDRAKQLIAKLTLTGDSPVDSFRAHGHYSAALEDWDHAAEFFEIAVEREPCHQRTVFQWGLALERIGQHDAARDALHRARLLEQVVLQSWRIARIDRTNPEYLSTVVLEIARLLSELGRPADAVGWLDQQLTIDPRDDETRKWRTALSRQAAATEPAAAAKKSALDETHWDAARKLRNAGAPAFHRPAESPEARTNVKFLLVDRHVEAGLDFQYRNGADGSKFLLETTGGGVAVCDFDADGWPDLYFPQGRQLPLSPVGESWPDRLFQNRQGDFRDVTEMAGLGDTQYSQGASAADFDNDGFVDLAVANYGTLVIYHNNGDGTLTDVTSQTGIAGEHWHSSLAWADFDGDGNLDLYAVTYLLSPFRVCRIAQDRIGTCNPINFQAEPDRLFHSRGDGSFADVSATSGIDVDDGKGLGIVVADFDVDGRPDIYVANDGTPNFLFHNETSQPGAPLKFVERGLVSGAAVAGNGISKAGMGIACSDFNGDRRLDLFVTNFYRESATLFLNQSQMLFYDVTHASGLEAATRYYLGFGTQALDLDLDGTCELFIANGHIDDFRFRNEPWTMPPQLFTNSGNAHFTDVSALSGEFFQRPSLGRGVARLDWDRDGRPELVVVHQDQPTALLHNETPMGGRRLVLDLHGTVSNRDAIGARIEIQFGSIIRVHEICGGDGYFASNERRCVLGLGDTETVDRIGVRWPSGRTDEWTNIPAESRLTLIENRPPHIHQLDSPP
jgi:tetratricopeptide (TPR) repeat protein